MTFFFFLLLIDDLNFDSIVNIGFSTQDKVDFHQEKYKQNFENNSANQKKEASGSSEHSIEEQASRNGSGKKRIFTSKNIIIFILVALLGCSVFINMYIIL